MNADSPSARWRRRAAAGIVVLAGCLLALPPRCYPARQSIGKHFNLLDGSWELDLPLQLARGAIAGRDFVFTYGPLYQFMHSPWLVGRIGDPASTLRFHGLWPTLLTVLGVWFVLRASGAALRWRAPLFLLWFTLWPPYCLFYKGMLGLVTATACGWCAGEATAAPSAPLRGKAILLWTVSLPLLTLYGFDLGIIAGAAMIGFSAFVVGITWGMGGVGRLVRKSMLLLAGLAIGGGLIFAVGVTLTEGWRSYLRESWEIARHYQTMMARGGPKSYLVLVGMGIVGSGLLCLSAGRALRLNWRNGNGDDRRILCCLAMCCFCLLWLRTGLTRSAATHLRSSLSPLMFVAGCWLPCWLSTTAPRGHWRFGAAAVAIPLVVISPAMKLWTQSGWGGLRTIELRPAQLRIADPETRAAVRAVEARTEPAVFVWPVESALGLFAGKANPAYTIQSYIAHSPRLERLFVDSLRRTPDLPVVFFRSKDELDGIEYLSRTPLIFRYLLEEYSLDGPCHPKFAILRRTHNRAEQWAKEPLSVRATRFRPGAGAEVKLSQEDSAAWSASEFALFEIRIAETTMLGIGKPGHIVVTFVLSDGSKRKQRLVLPHDGELHEVLVSACTVRDPLFLSAFHPRKHWRASERVVRLELSWAPIDDLSRAPTEIVLERIALLRRSDADVLEASLSEQEDEQVREALFGTSGVSP